MFVAYVAGVVDSDGSISIAKSHSKRKNPSYVASIQLSWLYNDKTLIVFEKLKEIYGGNISISNRTYKGTYKTRETKMYKYNITSQQAKKLLEDIQPFLLLKYEQCQTALDLINTTEFGKYGMGRPKPQELIDYHHSLYLKNKMVNTKNGKTNENN